MLLRKLVVGFGVLVLIWPLLVSGRPGLVVAILLCAMVLTHHPTGGMVDTPPISHSVEVIMLDLYPVGTGLELANGHVCPAYGHQGQDYRLSPLDPYQAIIAAHRDRERVQDALLSSTPAPVPPGGVEVEANQLATVAVITLGLAALAPGEVPTTADAWRIVGNTGLTARQILREATHCVASPDCPGIPIGVLRGPDGSRGVSCQGHAGNPRLWSFVF